jgi:hypothetical protein
MPVSPDSEHDFAQPKLAWNPSVGVKAVDVSNPELDQTNLDASYHEQESPCLKRKESDSFEENTKSISASSQNPFNLKPRFTRKDLQRQLCKYVKNIKRTPIEFWEVKLYDWTRDVHNSFDVIKVLDSIHHIKQLKNLEGELTSDELQSLNATVEKVIQMKP